MVVPLLIQIVAKGSHLECDQCEIDGYCNRNRNHSCNHNHNRNDFYCELD